MRIPGIIGGLGPETTADFYLQINHLAEQAGVAERPPCLVWNVPLPYQIEEDLLLNQRGLELYTPYLCDAARRLERGGADFLAVPCNTVHELYDEYSAVVSIPVLHIVDETVRRLKNDSVDSVVILATGQTVGSQMYQRELEQAGIGFEAPSPEDQEKLNKIVARLVGSEVELRDAEWMNELLTARHQNVGAVLLACTDFHIILKDGEIDLPVFDSMAVLAEATFEEIMS